MEKVEVKIISSVVLFVVTLSGALLPFWFLESSTANGRKKVDNKLKLLKSFAAGIFLGTCLLHLLPEARSSMLEFLGHNDYPLTELVVGLGFLLLFVIENIVLSCRFVEGTKSTQDTPVMFLKADDAVVVGRCSPGEQESGSVRCAHYGTVSNLTKMEPDTLNNRNSASSPSLLQENTESLNKEVNSKIIYGKNASASDTLSLIRNCDQHQHHHLHHGFHHVNITGFRSMMLLLALSMHTIFDGLVIGLQATTVLVWTLLIALSIHKALVAFSLGLSFLESHYRNTKEAIVYMLLFSLVAPAGVGVGTIVTEASFDEEIKSGCSGILQAIATGTFMYVTFMEGLKESFAGQYHLVNIFFVIVGFGCTCVLRYFVNDG